MEEGTLNALGSSSNLNIGLHAQAGDKDTLKSISFPMSIKEMAKEIE